MNSIAGLLRGLGSYYEGFGNHSEGLAAYSEAEPLYRKALEIISKSGSAEKQLGFPFIINDLACLYYKVGKYDEAEYLHQETLQIRRTTLGE